MNMARRMSAIVTVAAALAGCQTTNTAPDPNAAYQLSARLADVIGRCWFGPNASAAFADYHYSPERNADQSRVLIVRKDDPTGLPLLVIEATSGSTVDLYGPLLQTPEGPRLRGDIERWTKGSDSCSA
jgi:hypothetical protein